MARRVFFSFDFDRDVRRVVQVRSSWVVRAKGESEPFRDGVAWESVKRGGDKAISAWIEKQLVGTSVTVVLIGSATYDSRWVRHEIKRSYELGKGMLGIYIHKIKDPQLGPCEKGKNPFEYWTVTRDSRKIALSEFYSTYDWVLNNGYENIGSWIEAAAPAR